MATLHYVRYYSLYASKSFQSIGVTKEWRPDKSTGYALLIPKKFPINRRHQRMATQQFGCQGGKGQASVSNQ